MFTQVSSILIAVYYCVAEAVAAVEEAGLPDGPAKKAAAVQDIAAKLGPAIAAVLPGPLSFLGGVLAPLIQAGVGALIDKAVVFFHDRGIFRHAA